MICGFSGNYTKKGLKIKDFDLKMINDLARNHPYQTTMFLVYKYYCSYADEFEGDIWREVDYFELLDRYYRYGITFEDGQLYPKNTLFVKELFGENPPFRYIIRNNYDLNTRLYNDVKKISLDKLDNGEITLSEIEKWKRKVVNQQTNRKTKLRLLDPNVYHSLIPFFVFSNFKGRPHNKIDYELSWDGIEKFIKRLIIIKISINIERFMRIRFIIR